MKKLLLLSALALGALTANAQDITVTVEGNPVENGATVNSSRYEDILFQFGTLKLDPEVVATFSEATDVTVRVYNNTKNFTDNVQFCWPTTCLDIAPGQMKEQSSPVEANVPQGLAIDVTVYPFSQEEKYEFNTVVEILYGASETFTFNLNMVYPSAEDDAVEGILDDSVNAAPVYFDLNGRKINNPDKGIYIMQKGSKVSKVIL